jgi:hypothetical protein
MTSFLLIALISIRKTLWRERNGATGPGTFFCTTNVLAA